MPFLISILLFALALNVPTAHAQDTESAQTMPPHCMAALKPDMQSTVGGSCMGIIATRSFVSRVLPDNLKFCHPNTATLNRSFRRSAASSMRSPDAAERDFRLIALAAMRNKWPCQE
jgi:hypothetical protein